MNYLEFFHFDNHPFVGDENINYFYPKKHFLKIIDEMVKFCRFKSGIFIIIGNSGVGKTIVLNKILEAIENNDFVIHIRLGERTEILKSIAKRIGSDCKNISDILVKLTKTYTDGKNVIIAIDNAEYLSKDELISLDSLIKVIPSLKIILCGQRMLNKKLNQNVVKPIKKNIVKTFRIKRFSVFSAMKYLLYIEKNALALSQYKRVFSAPAVFLISLVANRSIKQLNLVAEKSLLNAFYRQSPKVYMRDVFRTLKENFDVVKYNIYQKIQKLFFYMLLLFSVYYTVKIVIDRNDLIKHIEAQESIRQQEKELRNA